MTNNDTCNLRDEDIVELFWVKNEKAISETDKKYKNYLNKILYNILGDFSDCEECLNDTYLAVWNAIPPAKPNSFKAFVTVIARRAAIKRYNKKLNKKNIPSELTLSLSEIDDMFSYDEELSKKIDSEQFSLIINNFIRSLPERKQFIFIGRFYFCNTIDAIAKELNLSRSMVNKELSAIRKLLKSELESEGYYYETK